MTNVVKRGAGRPAAAAKKNKHAQRTPLPPKERSGRENIVTHTSSVKKAAKEATQDKPGRGDVDLSKAKAKEVADYGKSRGWKSTVEAHDNDVVTLTAVRGDETLTIEWLNGRHISKGNTYYLAGGRQVRLLNASAVKKQMDVSKSEAASRNSEVVNHVNRVKAKREPGESGDAPRRAKLPFDANTSEDIQILEAVVGKRIVWRNRYSGLEESARVLPVPVEQQLQLRVDLHPENNVRILSFASIEGGLRSVRVDSILQVRAYTLDKNVMDVLAHLGLHKTIARLAG